MILIKDYAVMKKKISKTTYNTWNAYEIAGGKNKVFMVKITIAI